MALEQFQSEENIPAEVPAETPVEKPKATKEGLYATDAAVRLQKKRAEYEQHIQKLIDKFSNRQLGYNPQLLALGEGLLTPGKTGSFFEGLGTGMKGYREAGEKLQEQDVQSAKLENELRTGQIGQLEKDYALEQELAGDKYIRELAARRLQAPSEKLAVSDVSGKVSPKDILSSGATAGYGSGPGGLITQEDIMSAPKSAQKRIIEDYKRQQDDIKIAQESAKSTEVNIPFIGLQKISVQQQQDIARIVNSPQYQALPVEAKKALMQQYYADNGIGEVEYPSATTGKKPSMETASQKAVRVEGEKTAITKSAESNQKTIDTLEDRAEKSVDLINNSNIVYSLATDPKTKNAFGILARPGIAATFGEILREPLKFGDISVGVSNIENIIRKAGGTQEEIDAAATVARAMSQLELGFSSAFKGQGQVSDNERIIVRNVGPQLSDSPKVAALKAESIVARAEFDAAVAQQYANWQESHANGTVKQFTKSPEYKTIVSGYDAKLGNVLSKYGFTPSKIKTSAETEKAPARKSNLWEAIQRAKEEE